MTYTKEYKSLLENRVCRKLPSVQWALKDSTVPVPKGPETVDDKQLPLHC